MTRVMGIINQIRLHCEAIPDQRIVEKVLKSLLKKFKMVATTILESKDLSNFSTDELMGSLLIHETILHLEDESISNAFKTQFSSSRGREDRGHRAEAIQALFKILVTERFSVYDYILCRNRLLYRILGRKL
jgi:hypothetical protein